MVLEATVLCVDNSEWMRNGDYIPSRLEAQQDAVNLICGAKTQSNPENTVGVIACSGKSPEVLVTLTQDLGKILSSLHGLKIGTTLNFVAGIQVAQLALKHRQNKNQHQRVIFFVGSPIDSSSEELVRVGKRLKKNNIAVDIVNFGEEDKNTEKLEAFVGAVSNNDNSHLVTVPPGPHILSDILLSSAVITGSDDGGMGGMGGMGGGMGGGGGNNFEFGVDPNLDPELAMVIRVSMEEERQRQEAARKKEAEANASGTTTTDNSSTSTPAPSTSTTTSTSSTSRDATMDDIDDDELAQAIALSVQSQQAKSSNESKPSSSTSSSSSSSSTSTTSSTAKKPTTSSTNKDTEMKDLSEEDEMALALQLSMQESKGSSSTPSSTSTSSDINKVMEDPDFVNSVLKTLPGVDPNDERIKNVLASSLTKKDEKKDDKEKKDEKK